MNSESQTNNPSKKTKSLSEEIAVITKKLKKLQAHQREKQKKEREKNQKAVMALIKAERLDSISSNIWQERMPRIRALLMLDHEQRS